jgi:catechol 2,3-dioxygenase-like lactoylglutathione lyase family enzyme
VLALAKPALDVGLYTNRAEEATAFYEHHIGLTYDHALPVTRHVLQHRFRVHGSVLKVNASDRPLETAPSGYRSLTVAGDAAVDLVDPDGLPVRVATDLAPGVDTSVEVRTSQPDAHARFYRDGLGTSVAGDRFRLGTTELRLVADESQPPAGRLDASGFRYLTVQVYDVVAEHDRLVDMGAAEGMPPTRLGDVAAISFVRDPGGNWIEISQRASLTGPLPDTL